MPLVCIIHTRIVRAWAPVYSSKFMVALSAMQFKGNNPEMFMSSVVAAFLQAIRMRVKIVPLEKSCTKYFACRAVPEKRNVNYVSRTHKIERKYI